MDVDAGVVHVSNLHGVRASDGVSDDYDGNGSGVTSALLPEAALDVRALTRDFVEYYRLHNHRFVYMDMLRDNLAAGLHFLEVQLTHVQQFSGLLFSALQHSPTRTLPLMESAVAELAQERQLYAGNTAAALLASGRAALTSIQVQCFWPVPPLPLRQLAQATVARLVCVSGIVVKASASHARCVRAVIQCTSCRSKAYLAGARALELPPQCLENGNRNVVYDGGAAGAATATAPPTTGGGGGGGRRCRPNPYVLLPMECTYEDQQVLKLQELPEDVPTGELPRHVTVVVDRYLVDRVSPGTRVQVVGIVSVQEHRGNSLSVGGSGKSRGGKGGGGRATVGLRAQYIRCVGLMYLAVYTSSTSSSSGSSSAAGAMTDVTSSYNSNSSSSGSGGDNGSSSSSSGGGGSSVSVVSVNHNYSSRVRSRSAMSWQPEEEASFKAFAKSGSVYDKLTRSLDPAIFGLTDQKRAVVCLLFGGTRKRHGSSNYLRGDMNVLFIGDPSTAKSQLLKFTEKVAPIGVYTSGKGSSAAGLTAAVIAHGGGDFVLEAGSMVLADGGVVCIDEFDKMRAQDQVAIHEAMEQQTISIAKANLTTMLNSRTSVLAAANPSLGSYDPLRSDEEQMDFQGSILSRFDLIFKVVDPRNPELDHRLAQHVVNLHKGSTASAAAASAAGGGGADGPVVERGFFTKYVAYARATCYPTLSEEAMTVLLDFYVRVRRDAHRQTLEAMSSQSASSSSSFAASATSRHGGGGGGGGGRGGVPVIQITARQLESLVRIAEALARMRLDVLASRSDAEEAIRLFKAATVDAMHSGLTEQTLTEAQSEVVLRIEEAMRRRVALGATVEHNRLLSELMRMGFDARLVDRAIFAMVRREELEWRKQRTLLYRAR